MTFVTSREGFGQAGSFPGGDGNDIRMEDGPGSESGGSANDVDRTASDVSISILYKAASWTTGWQAILAHGEGQDYRIARQATTDPAVFAAVAGTSDVLTGSTYEAATPDPEVWHHLVVTATNGGISQLYVDGQLEGTSEGLNDPEVSITNSTNGNTNNNNVLSIGSNPERTERAFHGLIDEVAMWDRALTENEITGIYDAGINGEPLSTLLSSGDTDGDGLPNEWEILYNLNPDSADGENGADGDPDMDGATNIQEYERGSFPRDEDSDDDTILDGQETKTGVWVSVEDRGTDPLLKDSDLDGLEDQLRGQRWHFCERHHDRNQPEYCGHRF